MKKRILVSLVSTLVVGALSATPAVAVPALWTDSTAAKTLLRSVTTPPKNQPDALEWANNGPVVFLLQSKEPQEPILCNEVELGTTVLANDRVVETRLAMPFGIAEGDNCNQNTSAGGPMNVPTYFDTNAAGAVPAQIGITGPPLVATIKKLKLSQNKAGVFCTVTIEGIKGEIKNVTAGFVEEGPPNLNVTFEAQPVLYLCGKTKFPARVFANFFLETMSTTTDTAFVE